MDRKQISKILSLHRLVKDGDKIDVLLETPEEINRHILPKFKTYSAFSCQIHPELYASSDNYYWVKDFPEKEVSFLGLNSSWACESDDDRNNITLGYPQVMNAFKQSRAKNKVVLMHHPFDWLNELDFNRYRDEIIKNCSLILHGHTHADYALVIKNPSSSYICLGSNASYTRDKGGVIGFQFICLEFVSEGTVVTVWPFKLESRGGLRFDHDYTRWEKQEGKRFFKLETFEPEAPVKTGDASDPDIPLEIPREYKKWIRANFSYMDIDRLAPEGEVFNVTLPELYIPLSSYNPDYIEVQEHLQLAVKELGRIGTPEEDILNMKKKYIDIELLISKKKRILLRGGPGTGKTTLIKHLSYTITTGTCPDFLKRYLPVMIFLNDFWLIYNEELKKNKIEGNKKMIVFEDVMRLYLKKGNFPLTWEKISAFVEENRALFLLDGLDEVPHYIRPDLVDLIADFLKMPKEIPFLITSRPHGIGARANNRFGDYLYDIQQLDDEKVERFIKMWFRAIYRDAPEQAENKAKEMIADCNYRHISDFTKNPLLLTAICILYQSDKRIPHQRAELYNRIINNLINRKLHDPAQPGIEKKVLEFLMKLAFETQLENRKTIEKQNALRILGKTFQQGKTEPNHEYIQRLEELFEKIEPACGLLNRLSTGEIGFNHPTFQEFLSAKYIKYMDNDWRSYLELEWWEETLLLYIGLLSIDGKQKSNDIVHTILKLVEKEDKIILKEKRKKEKENRFVLISGKALCDIEPFKRYPSVVELNRKYLIEMIESKSELAQRFSAGIVLGELGDTRIGIDVIDKNMVEIPGGEFDRGAKNNKDAMPVKKVYLDAFMISKYPVVNQEFKCFLEDGGYRHKEFWTEEGWKWQCDEIRDDELYPGENAPCYWHNRKWNSPNFPVVGINWFEAAAYTNWLSEVTGKPYRLPTEAEWEKAARGPNGSIYPWGNNFDKNFCNTLESPFGRTNPVGIFPEGKSHYGCFDMCGNVWEWCWDWYSYSYYESDELKNPKGPSNGKSRVLRGGSWSNLSRDCTSVNRNAGLTNRPTNHGIRLVRSI